MVQCTATTLTGERCKLHVKEGETCSKHSGESCSICFFHMNSRNSSTLPNCNHIFHKKCIDRWKKKNNTCPICRVKIENIKYNISIHIEPVGINATMVSNTLSMFSTLFGVETNDNYITDIQFSTEIEDDIRHILQEIGFPVTTFPARTQ
jgi:Ring finger domain